jgi:hypothetical protein
MNAHKYNYIYVYDMANTTAQVTHMTHGGVRPNLTVGSFVLYWSKHADSVSYFFQRGVLATHSLLLVKIYMGPYKFGGTHLNFNQ